MPPAAPAPPGPRPRSGFRAAGALGREGAGRPPRRAGLLRRLTVPWTRPQGEARRGPDAGFPRAVAEAPLPRCGLRRKMGEGGLRGNGEERVTEELAGGDASLEAQFLADLSPADPSEHNSSPFPLDEHCFQPLGLEHSSGPVPLLQGASYPQPPQPLSRLAVTQPALSARQRPRPPIHPPCLPRPSNRSPPPIGSRPLPVSAAAPPPLPRTWFWGRQEEGGDQNPGAAPSPAVGRTRASSVGRLAPLSLPATSPPACRSTRPAAVPLRGGRSASQGGCSRRRIPATPTDGSISTSARPPSARIGSYLANRRAAQPMRRRRGRRCPPLLHRPTSFPREGPRRSSLRASEFFPASRASCPGVPHPPAGRTAWQRPGLGRAEGEAVGPDFGHRGSRTFAGPGPQRPLLATPSVGPGLPGV
ncbi:formin-like protein 14 [Cervus elaphus]|uniref:formin-like protein 14 n=1 Tax=Cervus elaphus TaxID=9860 RepID=UPI001CC32C7E|nr:formin-like protein 14 [Cervus elaphus]